MKELEKDMDSDIKIRQSYHGTGGREGYRFKVYNPKGRKIGEIADIPTKCNVGDTVYLGGNLYQVTKIYDSPLPREEKTEVIYYELSRYVFQPTYDLGDII